MNPHVLDPKLEAYVLRLYEKGYSVAELANQLGKSVPETRAVIERAATARVESSS
jgi:DNA-directed RNA polymerase specialized sigma24 family protein